MQSAAGSSGNQQGFYGLVIPLMIAESVAALELTMIYAAMRTLVGEFGGTSQAGWLVTSFMLSSAAGAALFGRLGDLLGRRNILVAVLALSTLGSAISSVTSELWLLVIGRTLQGFAGAIVPLCFGMIRERVSPERVSLGIGLITSTVTIASASGLVIGGLIIDHAHWSVIFQVSTGLGVIALLTVLLFVTKDKLPASASGVEDIAGGLLFIPSIVCLLLGITRTAKYGLLEIGTLAWLAGAVVFMTTWIWRELRVTNPLINVRLLLLPSVAWPNILSIFVAIGVFQGGHLMALFGQQSPSTGTGLGLSATMAAMLLLPANIMASLTAPFVAGAVKRFGPRQVAYLGCAMMSAAFFLLALFNDSVLVVVLLLILQGVGLGLFYVTMPIILVHASPPDRTSESAGMMAVLRSTAMAIGAQTVAVILAVGHGGQGKGSLHTFPTEADYRMAFLFVAATAFMAFALCRNLPKKLTEGQAG